MESNRESYDFRVVTPWVFGLSLGHTVGNYLALGATVEYTDYSSTKTRYEDLALYDPYYGDVYKDSSNDKVMNRHTDNTLKGVATVKLGAEYKPLPNLALRAGYNYVSPKYKSSGEKATYEYSQDYRANDPIGIYYTSTTDFTNWKGTNRVTFGIGYQIDRWNIDLAYQYSASEGRLPSIRHIHRGHPQLRRYRRPQPGQHPLSHLRQEQSQSVAHDPELSLLKKGRTTVPQVYSRAQALST